MKHVSILPATAEDVLYIAEHIRPADLAEFQAVHGPGAGVLGALMRGYFKSTRAWVGHIDGTPTALFGYVKMGEMGIPWMVATEDFKRYAKSSITKWHPLLDEMQNDCKTLINYVHAENHDAIRWLRYMGFFLLPKVPLGHSEFHPFVRTSHV